ncbi:uncharacterized protein F5891DRAFT_943149 [Suillus fuscotomentosus]|uniref:Uncharacterized protein n=1 Tax=Suillus fuscotomentosus TaxID=1912939 RepID=A0AAD4HS91_9AGAM|nr:uncharacterized protein F5891DRAFT_943149 [Suillus fuscotomentosus]KAG1905699.1 hypothetical protein F5891DRAFT_943149 [Suillus fuscotomentosus]
MKQFKFDNYAEEKVGNPHFPFTSKPDWEMVAFLLRLDLSMADIDEFLKLKFVKHTKILPSPPQWKYQVVPMEFPTMKTVHIFYWDTIKCLQLLLSHPMLADSFEFIPWKIYAEAKHAIHIYYGFMTGPASAASSHFGR